MVARSGSDSIKEASVVQQSIIPRVTGQRISLLLLVFLLLAGCSGIRTGEFPEDRPEVGKGRTFVVWMLSDIQPPTLVDRLYFEQAIADVNERVEQVDMAVIAGDLLKSRSQDEDFSWFLSTRNRSKVRHWYEIAGNHDVRSEPLFHQYFPRPSYYGVELGNILLLLLSDALPSSKTDISDEAFQWWRDMVLRNQDRIIITVTHGQLENSGLLGSSFRSRQIEGSKRFKKVLREARVAVWASGHTHLPQGFPGTVSIPGELGGTCFVNVSSIDTGPFMASQSRFMIFEEGSDRLQIRSRNHRLGRFDEELDIFLTLDRPFVLSGGEPSLIIAP
ncbi:MAG: metallophosphoesterase [Proteobacteria bacterium]|nr:metallophosphoesterase [Pseudomonadota bacterium]